MSPVRPCHPRLESDFAAVPNYRAHVAARNTRPTLVLLVRHGMTPTTGVELYGRRPGVHLAEQGIQQANAVATRIAGIGSRRVSAIYSSPLERTRETAAPIAKACGLRVRQASGLLELDMGTWTGRKLRDLRKLKAWQTVQKYPSGFRFPKGESFPEMQTRMSGAVHDLVDQHPGQTIVAVSHADPVRALVAAAMGTHLDLFQRIVISPCSVTAIMYGASGPVVLAVNSTGSLRDLSPA
jgi:probable phosphomutase (TIGR03848 family)